MISKTTDNPIATSPRRGLGQDGGVGRFSLLPSAMRSKLIYGPQRESMFLSYKIRSGILLTPLVLRAVLGSVQSPGQYFPSLPSLVPAVFCYHTL